VNDVIIRLWVFLTPKLHHIYCFKGERMTKLLQVVLLFFLFTSYLLAQTLAARISNARVEGSEFKWDIEINRTDDWGSGGGNDALGNSDFYFFVNVDGFSSSNPTLTNIHASIDGNDNFIFTTGRAGSGSQCYVALAHDGYGGGTDWYPPLNSWELLFTVSLPITNTLENSGLAWHESSTGFARANTQPLTAVLSVDGQADISLPVELTNFNANFIDDHIHLNWTTESELNNLGFEILRSDEQHENYSLISTYLNNEDLEGSGNSSAQKTYSFIDNTISSAGTYWYKLVDTDYSGMKTSHPPISVTISSSELLSIEGEFPTEFKLHQNYPNPFNPSTKISFDIPDQISGKDKASILIFNSLGMVVKRLYSGNIAPGRFQLTWDGKSDAGVSLPTGIYFTKLILKNHNQTIKMTLLK